MGTISLGFKYGLLVGAVGGLLGASAGCSSAPTGPGLRLQVAQAAGDLTCQRSMAAVPFTPLLRDGTLRLSVLRRDPDGTHFQCDLTAAAPSEKPTIDLGPVDRSKIDIYGELFDANGMLVLSGAALGAANIGSDGNPQVLPLFPAAQWSCPASLMGTGRAFHSATLLPSGEVLLLGGIEGVPGYGPDVFGVLASAEIYDPRHGTFVTLTPGMGGIVARAFHQTAVVSSTDTQVTLLAYGGITATPKLPVLAVANSASTIRVSPAGTAVPAGAELLVYDMTAHTITSTPQSLGQHMTAFAGGAPLYGGGLLVVGGSTFASGGAFNKSIPTTLNQNGESVVGTLPGGAGMPAFAYSASAPAPAWLLGSAVVPLSASTAVALGAQVPPTVASPINMLGLSISGLPQAATLASAAGTTLMGAPTVYHTATRLGPPIGASSGTGDSQILVTGGFVMTSQPPQSPGQPPTAANAVRMYTVHNPTGAMSFSEQAVPVYGPTTNCGASDGHYRPAGFESAALTISGQKVLVTGGTPTVNYAAMPQCLDCESTDTATDKLLCVLSQSSLYDSSTSSFSSAPKLSLGRMGHQQTTLLDGNILLTGGLIRPGGDNTAATPEAEVYNPRAGTLTGNDPEDPVGPYLSMDQKSMRAPLPAGTGMGLASPCPVL